jgi:hypothetical protein
MLEYVNTHTAGLYLLLIEIPNFLFDVKKRVLQTSAQIFQNVFGSIKCENDFNSKRAKEVPVGLRVYRAKDVGVKRALEQAMKARKGSSGIALLSL